MSPAPWMGRTITVRPLSSWKRPGACTDADPGPCAGAMPAGPGFLHWGHPGESRSDERVIGEGGPGLLVVGVPGVGTAADGIVAGDRGPAGGHVPGDRTAADGGIPGDGATSRGLPAHGHSADGVDPGTQAADPHDAQAEAADRDQPHRQSAEAQDAETPTAYRDESAGVIPDGDPAAGDPAPFLRGGRVAGVMFNSWRRPLGASPCGRRPQPPSACPRAPLGGWGQAGFAGAAPRSALVIKIFTAAVMSPRGHRGTEIDVDQRQAEEPRLAAEDPVADPVGHRGPAGAGPCRWGHRPGSRRRGSDPARGPTSCTRARYTPTNVTNPAPQAIR